MIEEIEILANSANMEQVHIYHQGAADTGYFAGVSGGRFRFQTGAGVSCDGLSVRRTGGAGTAA